MPVTCKIIAHSNLQRSMSCITEEKEAAKDFIAVYPAVRTTGIPFQHSSDSKTEDILTWNNLAFLEDCRFELDAIHWVDVEVQVGISLPPRENARALPRRSLRSSYSWGLWQA